MKNRLSLNAAALLAVLVIAFVGRLWNIDYGLPSMHDADEPMFMLRGLNMLDHATLNPGWFGHPGTVTIYTIMVVEAVVGAVSMLGGGYASLSDYGVAIFSDPTPLVLTTRLVFMLFGVASVWLTYRLAARLYDPWIGVGAALFLAVDPLHVTMSQVIRTDVQATFFMLLATWFSVRFYEDTGWRHAIFAGMLVGVGAATKWPAALAIAIPMGCVALLGIERRLSRSQVLAAGAVVVVATLAGLLIASPYLIAEWHTVMANIGGEARPDHPGSTGQGLLLNLQWYVTDALAPNIGVAGLALAAVGGAVALRRSRIGALCILLFPLLFIAAISGQSLRWARWIVPALPFIAIALSLGFVTIVALAARLFAETAAARRVLAAVLLAAIVVPMVSTAAAQARERGRDTRTLAVEWAQRHVPAGKIILIEYFGFAYVSQPWSLRFPAGELGCVEPMAILRGKLDVGRTDAWRGGRSVVDIGNINPREISTCLVSDYVILTNYERYRADPARYPSEYAMYQNFLSRGDVVATFAPQPGAHGGPVTRVLRLRHDGGDRSR